MDDETFESGKGWPYPDEPGVPGNMLADGFHWLEWPKTQQLTIGQWSPDCWCWVISYWGNMVEAELMAHLNYLGPIKRPMNPSTEYERGRK